VGKILRNRRNCRREQNFLEDCLKSGEARLFQSGMLTIASLVIRTEGSQAHLNLEMLTSASLVTRTGVRNFRNFRNSQQNWQRNLGEDAGRE